MQENVARIDALKARHLGARYLFKTYVISILIIVLSVVVVVDPAASAVVVVLFLL